MPASVNSAVPKNPGPLVAGGIRVGVNVLEVDQVAAAGNEVLDLLVECEVRGGIGSGVEHEDVGAGAAIEHVPRSPPLPA